MQRHLAVQCHGWAMGDGIMGHVLGPLKLLSWPKMLAFQSCIYTHANKDYKGLHTVHCCLMPTRISTCKGGLQDRSGKQKDLHVFQQAASSQWFGWATIVHISSSSMLLLIPLLRGDMQQKQQHTTE